MKKYQYSGFFILGSLLVSLAGCGGGDANKSEGKSASTPAATTMSYPRTLQYTGTDSVTRMSCTTPAIQVRSDVEYCQELKSERFGSCARDQRDRHFIDHGCPQVLARTAQAVTDILCIAMDEVERSTTGWASLFSDTLIHTKPYAALVSVQRGQQARSENQNQNPARPFQQHQQMSQAQSSASIRAGSVSVRFSNAVMTTGNQVQVRMDLQETGRRESREDREYRESLGEPARALFQSTFVTTIAPQSIYRVEYIDEDAAWRSLAVSCIMPSQQQSQSSGLPFAPHGQWPFQQPHFQQPHHPQVLLPNAGRIADAGTNYKIKCEGSIKRPGQRPQRLESEMIEAPDHIGGGEVALFDETGGQEEFMIEFYDRAADSPIPQYRVKGAHVGANQEKQLETAAALSRNQTLSYKEGSGRNSAYEIQVNCQSRAL